MAKKKKEKKLSDVEIEVRARVELVADLMRSGMFSISMITNYMNKDIALNKEKSVYNWPVTRRTVLDYIKKAKKLVFSRPLRSFKDVNSIVENALEQALISAIANGDDMLILNVTDRLAKLHGMYDKDIIVKHRYSDDEGKKPDVKNQKHLRSAEEIAKEMGL